MARGSGHTVFQRTSAVMEWQNAGGLYAGAYFPFRRCQPFQDAVCGSSHPQLPVRSVSSRGP